VRSAACCLRQSSFDVRCIQLQENTMHTYTQHYTRATNIPASARAANTITSLHKPELPRAHTHPIRHLTEVWHTQNKLDLTPVKLPKGASIIKCAESLLFSFVPFLVQFASVSHFLLDSPSSQKATLLSNLRNCLFLLFPFNLPLVKCA